MEECTQPGCQISFQAVDEIEYYMAYICLKRLKDQGHIPLEELRAANVAIAEKHRVLPYEI